MTEYKANKVKDGKGGEINFPFMITQEHMDLINKEFAIQNDDIFVVTFPRSGTTWTEQIVHLLINHGEQGDKILTEAVPWLETLPHHPNGFHGVLKEMRGRRLFTSHLPFPLMPYNKNSNAKYIYVARNPKDVAISFYFHDQSKGGYQGTWDEHFQLFMDGKLTFGSYFDHVLPWWKASKDNDNILFLKYEDMKKEHARHVAKIGSFLGLQTDFTLIEKIVTMSSFQSMSSNTNTNFEWIPQKEGVPGHFRKGEIGDWKNHFTEIQNQRLEAAYKEMTKNTGLEFDFGG